MGIFKKNEYKSYTFGKVKDINVIIMSVTRLDTDQDLKDMIGLNPKTNTLYYVVVEVESYPLFSLGRTKKKYFSPRWENGYHHLNIIFSEVPNATKSSYYRTYDKQCDARELKDATIKDLHETDVWLRKREIQKQAKQNIDVIEKQSVATIK